jgi:mono/diheme cytochrome c family protein
MKRLSLLFPFICILLVGCGLQTEPALFNPYAPETFQRYTTDVPDDFAGLANPLHGDEAAIAAGAALYAEQCAVCHGDQGLGDGSAAGVGAEPVSPLAWSDLLLGDDYLFWRITEGGGEFGSSMPAYPYFTEQQRWGLVAYISSLGTQSAVDAGIAHMREVLTPYVTDGAVIQQDADTFLTVFSALLSYQRTQTSLHIGTMLDIETAALDDLITLNVITPDQLEAYYIVSQTMAETKN